MCVAIEIDNLTKFYGKNRGIEGVSISVKEGALSQICGNTSIKSDLCKNPALARSSLLSSL